MAAVVFVDIRWLLQQHERALPSQPGIDDFSALVAAVARHRVDPPRLGVDSDASWRAAALLQTLLVLRPLPTYNVRYACAITIAYMHVSGEGLDTPYGELIDLARDLMTAKATVFDAADQIRSWRI
jgi:prophage maintenance system killer protein